MKLRPKTRIALCISGQIRKEWKITLQSIKKYIIDALDADVFFSFNSITDEHVKSIIIDMLQPKDYVFQDMNIEHDDGPYSKNFSIMMTRMIDCNNMKKYHEQRTGKKYDIVIKIRPDMLMKECIPKSIVYYIQPNTVYAYEFRYIPIINFLGITDQFFISDSVTMDKLIRNDVIREMKEITYCKYNEYALYKHAVKNGINIKYFYSPSLLYKFIDTNLISSSIKFLQEKGFIFGTKSICSILN
jgi:hypothetical protein